MTITDIGKWPTRKAAAQAIADALARHSKARRSLPGVQTKAALDTLAWQIVASIRRFEYTDLRRRRPIHKDRANPASPLFEPELAAVLHAKSGRFDDAIWLLFLATHFGKHPVHGWKRLRDVYSGLGDGIWTWERVSADPSKFRSWLRKRRSQIGGAFSNHRKYETLSADSAGGTAAVVESYVAWIGKDRSHRRRFGDLIREAGNDPRIIFDRFYSELRVKRFGRLGKFDFLALLGRLDLAPIEPPRAYLSEATGPLKGARLLFGGSPTVKISPTLLEDWLDELDGELRVGKQVLEDALCNWQKSPRDFVHFRG